MLKHLLSITVLTCSVLVYGQITEAPRSIATGEAPIFTSSKSRAAVDSCGAYYNNYVGLTKTSTLFFESMRVGNATETGFLSGRAQRFHAPQPIEVSGIQFYAFQTNPAVDSIMVITVLYDYDDLADNIGAELARDTVYVKETTFDAVLPNREVNSTFDPVTVTEDYIVAIQTETDDSLKIYTNDPGGDGAGEALAFAHYTNPAFPGSIAWYESLGTYGPSYNVDYLISPLVKYDLHDDWTLVNDTICPTAVGVECVDYTQMPVFADPHYNNNATTPLTNIQWLWGDGFQNTSITSGCHTYGDSGDYGIVLNDSLRRHFVPAPFCRVSITKNIHVLDSVVADFSSSSVGFTADFTNTTSQVIDSVAWDFGDGTTAGDNNTPTHVYSALGDYDVWFYAYGPCNTDSTMMTININDLSVGENNFDLNVYPNPTNNLVTIEGQFFETDIHIYNLLGEEVYYNLSVSGKETIDCSSWPAGAYLVQLINEHSEKNSKLIVK